MLGQPRDHERHPPAVAAKDIARAGSAREQALDLRDLGHPVDPDGEVLDDLAEHVRPVAQHHEIAGTVAGVGVDALGGAPQADEPDRETSGRRPAATVGTTVPTAGRYPEGQR